MKVTIIPVGTLGTNCYLLASEGGGCAIVDPGAQADKIAGVIEQEKLTPRLILLTHCHYDHIGGVKTLQERYPEAATYIGREDMDQLTDAEKSVAIQHGLDRGQYIIDKIQPLADGDELTLDELTVRVVETPGHTRGGVCYLVNDVMFAGDTLFRDDIGRCDLFGGDYGVMKQTLAKLVALDGDYTVYPGHGESTTLDYERQHNRYINE